MSADVINQLFITKLVPSLTAAAKSHEASLLDAVPRKPNEDGGVGWFKPTEPADNADMTDKKTLLRHFMGLRQKDEEIYTKLVEDYESAVDPSNVKNPQIPLRTGVMEMCRQRLHINMSLHQATALKRQNRLQSQSDAVTVARTQQHLIERIYNERMAEILRVTMLTVA